MTTLLRSPAIRAIEQAALARGEDLMARAGLAAAGVAREMLVDARRTPARVLVLAGPGNNGGDGFEVATHLRHWNFEVVVLCIADPARMPQDARAAWQKWRSAGGACVTSLPAPAEFDLVIDAIFGIGLTRPVQAPYAGWILAVNAVQVPVLALDLPSGLDADTGSVHGVALAATRCVTFIADKPGLRTQHGPDLAGHITVATLELRAEAPPGPEIGALLEPAHFAAALAPRTRNTHKGSFGALGIVGGADGMAGAALLAGRAALKLGAGRVLVGFVGNGLAVDPLQPDLMLRAAAEVVAAPVDALVIGPGLGTSGTARTLLAQALALRCPLLLDADALNLIAQDAKLAAALTRHAHGTVLTPHPLEAARLLGQDVQAVQRDRIAAAQALARVHGADVVLKGAGSIVAASAGDWWINPTGNPGMATGGMGDVLSGLAGALLARGVPCLAAVQCAVHLHGAAADRLVGDGIGPAGLTAGETIDAARCLFNQWVRG